jgi:hypothetical protein
MPSSTRNLLVIAMGLLSSLLLAALLFVIEVHTGKPLFSTMLWTYLPAGAIGAGAVVAAGCYAGARMLRIRPTLALPLAILAIGVGTVYLMDSVEFGISMGLRSSVTSPTTAAQFVETSLAMSPLRTAFSGGSDSDADSSKPTPGFSSGSFSASSTMPSVPNDSNNAAIQGIGGGVQGMMASGNALSADNISTAMSGASQRIAGLKAFGMGVLEHATWLELAILQMVGFVLAGGLVFWQLRTLPYCDGCKLFLSKKGEQTRYFDSMRDTQHAVDNFLTKVKGRQYRQSIQEHFGVGSKAKTDSSSFASTVEISRCMGCPKHKLDFRAERKEGRSWKPIDMLRYTTFCVEPIEIGGASPNYR